VSDRRDIGEVGSERPRAAEHERALTTLLVWTEGFVVDTPSGEVGVVEEVMFSGGHVAALRVRARQSDDRWLVPVEHVTSVLPRSQTILIARHPAGSLSS
jgi:hypothetical protein